MFDYTLKLLLRRLSIVFLIFSILRIGFFLFNYSSFYNTNFVHLLIAFVHGFRFDLAAIIIINSAFIFISLLPHLKTANKTLQRILYWLFLLTNLPFIGIAVIDLEFFKFIGRRSGNEVFTITNDILAQSTQLIQYYWYLVLFFLVLIVVTATLYPKYPRSLSTQHNTCRTWLQYTRLIIIIPLLILGIRGGFQLKPLRPAHAFIHEQAILGHFSLNTPFNLIKSIGKSNLEEKHYFSTDDQLFKALVHNDSLITNPDEKQIKENIVIIILESFSAEYVGALNNGKGYTPFLDSLANKSLLFRNNFANGRKSIEGIPSIMSGLPSLLPEPFITSPYLSNKVNSVGHLLRNAGYTTSFFHGADNGTMGFDQFTELAGIEHYYGLNEYPSTLQDRDYDGNWGIFDEPYLQYVQGEINTYKQPFLSVIFTLSSHHPYTIPDKYKNKFPKGELEIHESIGYTDHALREFFRSAARQPWYSNTLFILVADHTQKSATPEIRKELDHYRVPLILFHPGKELKADVTKVTQHVDILPTVADYLNLSSKEILPFGQSVLKPNTNGEAIFFNGASYYLVKNTGITELTPEDKINAYTFPKMEPLVEKPDDSKKLKAYVQYIRNKMISNDLYFWLKYVK